MRRFDHERYGFVCHQQQRPLGNPAVSESTTALESNAESSLLRLATDQADISNVVFEQVGSEMDTLAGYADTVRQRPVLLTTRPLFPRVTPPDPKMHRSISLRRGSPHHPSGTNYPRSPDRRPHGAPAGIRQPSHPDLYRYRFRFIRVPVGQQCPVLV